MHLLKFKKYYFIDNFNPVHLKALDKNISLIWRNKNKETKLKDLEKLRNFCKKYQKKLSSKLNFDCFGASGLSKSSRTCNLNSGVQILSFVGARSVELRPFYVFYHHFSTFWDFRWSTFNECQSKEYK